MIERKQILNGDIAPTLFKLTTPMVGGIIATFIFNLADTYFVSLLGTEPLAAISFTFPVTMLILNVAIGLSIGVSALVSGAIGSGQTLTTQRLVTHSLFFTFIASFVILLLGWLGFESLFLAMGITESLLPLTMGYMKWWLLGIVGFLFMVVANGAIRASGNTRLPGRVMIISAVLNLILDPILIFGWGPIPALGIEGAAIASLISWYVVSIPLCKKLIEDEFLLSGIGIKKLKQDFNSLMATALPAIGTNTLGPLANMVVISLVALHGEAAVAAFGVGSRLEPFAVLVVLALTASLPPFVGQNFGAGNYDRIELALRKTIRFVVFWQAFVYLVMVLCSGAIASLFSSDQAVIGYITLFIWIVPVTYIGVGTVLVINSTLNAMQKASISLAITIFRLFALYIPACALGSYLGGIEGIYIGAAISNALIGFCSYIFVFKVLKKKSAKF